MNTPVTVPVTESTVSAKWLAVYLQEIYQLNADTHCRLFRTGINHLYIVQYANARMVFRIYTLNWRSRREIEEELRFLLHLKKEGISVSYPIPDANGNFAQEINSPEGLRYGVMFSWAEGKKQAQFPPEASYNLGVAMAHLHKASQNFPIDRISYHCDTLISEPYSALRKFFTDDSPDTDFIKKAGECVKDAFLNADRLDLRTGTVHLDIWFDNLHFSEDWKVTLFDFDFCGNGWLCLDIGYFAYQLYNTNPQPADFDEKLKLFFAGYNSVTEISAEEKRLIPFTGLAVFLYFLGIQCRFFDTWSNIFLTTDHLKRFVGLLRKWSEYHQLTIKD